jgi:hypothetical protein
MSNPYSHKLVARARYSKRVDPEKYSAICPACSTRFGEPHRLGYIEVKRCGKCPTLIREEQMMANKRGRRRTPEEARRG